MNIPVRFSISKLINSSDDEKSIKLLKHYFKNTICIFVIVSMINIIPADTLAAKADRASAGMILNYHYYVGQGTTNNPIRNLRSK